MLNKKVVKVSSLNRQSGLTLIELMVALALGLFLTVIMGTMYLSSKVSFTTSTQVARAQENLRFSSYFLQRDLRESTYSECGSRNPATVQLDSAHPDYYVEATKSGVMGWEYSGTDESDTFALTYTNLDADSTIAEIATARAGNTALASQWENSNGDDLPSLIHGFSPLVGSDVIMISSERRTSAKLVVVGAGIATDNTNPDIAVDDNGAGLMLGNILKIGTCAFTDKFQNTSTNSNFISTGTGTVTGFSPGNAAAWSSPDGNPWSVAQPFNAPVFVESTKVFYIRTGSGGIPALWRYSSDCGLSTIASGCAENVELAEGVENMQVFYGEDTDAVPDDVANIYRSADNVTDFDNVVSLRIGLLLRSTEETEVDDTNTYDLSDKVEINPDDHRLIRFVSNITVHLRNRGL